MPARDLYHPHVVDALLRDGWVITHDPLVLRFGAKDLFIDPGAERVLAAEKAGRKIAIEVKSFVGPSEVRELELGSVSSFFTARRSPSNSPNERSTSRCARRCTATCSKSRPGRFS